jgi:hypothetical protein
MNHPLRCPSRAILAFAQTSACVRWSGFAGAPRVRVLSLIIGLSRASTAAMVRIGRSL